MNQSAPQTAALPVALANFVQPGFPFAKVFSVYFMDGQMVFAKVGSGGTNAAGTMRASLGGATPMAMIAGAIGGLLDSATEDRRLARSVQLADQRVAQLLDANRHNFALPLATVTRVELRGPNWFREVKVLISAESEHKFRIDKQSTDSLKAISSVFQQFLPGRVFVE